MSRDPKDVVLGGSSSIVCGITELESSFVAITRDLFKKTVIDVVKEIVCIAGNNEFDMHEYILKHHV